MSRDKQQIEEMAKIACVGFREGDCENCKSVGICSSYTISKKLYNAGYRKAEDVAIEVIKKVEQILTVKIIGFEEDFFHGTAAHWDGIRKGCYEEILVELAELKKKYEGEGADDETPNN